MESARNYCIDQVLITSTSEVYGSAQTVPINENHPIVGQSPYAASKISADQLAESMENFRLHCENLSSGLDECEQKLAGFEIQVRFKLIIIQIEESRSIKFISP